MKSLFAGFLIFGLVACGQQELSSSDLQVTNGIAIAEDVFPSTVLLVMQQGSGVGICSATFVNDRQALTASHCVLAFKNLDQPFVFYVTTDPDDEFSYVQAESVVVQANYSFNLSSGVNRYDLAIVNFPPNTAPAYSSIAKATPDPGSDIVIVGYGNNEKFLLSSGQQFGQGSGVKRAGVNRLQGIDNGMLVFAGLPSNEDGYSLGQLVSVGSGDSGGPMFVGGQLVGVTSGSGLVRLWNGDIISISRYVDLNSDVSRKFLDAHLISE